MADSRAGAAAPEPALACLTDRDVEERLTALDGLLGELDGAEGDLARAAREAVTALAEVYGTALLRLARLARTAEGGPAAIRGDRLVRHLLGLHGAAEAPGEDLRRGSWGYGAPPPARRHEPALIPVEALLRRPSAQSPASPGAPPAPAAPPPPGREAEAPGDRCDLCGQPAPPGHRHVLDVSRREALCACRSCAILFSSDGADARYRLIPGRRRRLPGLAPADLGVPVGLAFFVRRAGGSVMAHYPSPAGATQWELDQDHWQAAVSRCPELADLAEDVEAVLVNTARGQSEAWLAPIDDCYRLVAAVRATWEGITGGDRVWPQVEQFFAGLASAS